MFNLIPQPKNVSYGSEKGFDSNKLIFNRLAVSSGAFKDFCGFCHNLGISVDIDENNANCFVQKNEALKEESYVIRAENDAITIDENSQSGVFYALQTLKQILIQSGGRFNSFAIVDEPNYALRGFMLDVGRYFFTVDEVKGFLDRMALHKLNTFHFHLTEDQGWRVEIEKYPLLTEKGSKRNKTNIGFKKQDGFYTKSDIKEIVSYAHDRYIKVIPEFDIPGHTRSAIACYPFLSCFDRKLKVADHWGVKHDVLCVGKESTYKFVYDVLDEIVEMFPDKTVHIGGDEVPKMRWQLCPHCTEKMKAHGLNNAEELQQYFMSQVEKYLHEKGVSSVMWNWDSIEPTKHLDKNIMWTLCGYDERTKNTVAKELESGRKMINTKAMEYYLDMPYGYVNLKRCCNYNPEEFITGGNENFLGVEAPLWTEFVPDVKTADFLTFPRLAAVANTAWYGWNETLYSDLNKKLPDYFKLLDFCNIGYATKNKYDMAGFGAKLNSLWFERRQLYWQGVYNLIDDAAVKVKYK